MNQKNLAFEVISASSKLSSDIGDVKHLEKSNPQSPQAGSHRGWISSRSPHYPQEILLHMDHTQPTVIKLKRIEVLSHHFLIPSRIEFFISADGDKFKRLGYVKMSDNNDTEYRARELKSVHLNASGKILKILVHEPHTNKHNKHQQVGLVAIGLYGIPQTAEQVLLDEVIDRNLKITQNHHSEIPITPKSGDSQRTNNLNSNNNLDSLMFDPQLGPALQRLEAVKTRAIATEQYDTCIQIKVIQSYLSELAPKFGNLEVHKAKALADEDYAQAKSIKLQQDELRLLAMQKIKSANVIETPMMTPTPTNPPFHSRSNHKSDLPMESPRELNYNNQQTNNHQQNNYQQQENLQNIPPLQNSEYPTPRTNPAVQNNSQINQLQLSPSVPIHQPLSPRNNINPQTSWDDHVPSALRNGGNKVDYSQVIDDSEEGKPRVVQDNPLTDRQRNESEAYFNIFGEEMTAWTYSKKFDLKIQALEKTLKLTKENPDGLTSSRAELSRSILPVCLRLFKDKVAKVFEADAQLFLHLVSKQFGLKGNEISYLVDKCLPSLLQVSAENNRLLREASVNTILSLDKELTQQGIVPQHVLVPFNYRKKVDSKHAIARIGLASKIFMENRSGQFDNANVNVANLVEFVKSALEHVDGNVRQAAVTLLGDIHQSNLEVNSGDPKHVRKLLPYQSEDYANVNPLWKNVFDVLDKIEGKPTQRELRKQKGEQQAAAEAKKKGEIQELQNQIQNLKNLQQQVSGKPESSKIAGEVKHNKVPDEVEPIGLGVAGEEEEEEEDDEHVCIFCGERDGTFNEQGLDLHYWKHCPMLKRCEYCGQVTEVAAYHDHLTVECEAKDQIPKEAVRQANEDKIKANKCTLCEKIVEPGTNGGGLEEAWQLHLMGEGKDACLANPRRLPFLKRVRAKQNE